MTDLASELGTIAAHCEALAGNERLEQATSALDTLLARTVLNPTGDDPLLPANAPQLPHNLPEDLTDCFQRFREHLRELSLSAAVLPDMNREQLNAEIRRLSDNGMLNDALAEKFRVPGNRAFLDLALHNAMTPWQTALVANWVLNRQGVDALARGIWQQLLPESNLMALIDFLLTKVTFRHTPTLRHYRRDDMHHYPRVSEAEFAALESSQWQDVIDLPSGRESHQDIPCITPFTKQGDIEHSLYRHFIMPDLLETMRQLTPDISRNFQFAGEHRALLFGLPFVVQQVEEELFNQIKQAIAAVIRQWAGDLPARPESTGARALNILTTLWNYRRSPPARDCSSPVENLIKGFTATIRNGFGHLKDINLAASSGSTLDPLDVAEKMVLFASVSNGQLDNLAAAHDSYLKELANPADWDNDTFFQHFLSVNRRCHPGHIQAHFLVDKTRGCPAMPQIARFHAIVFDLVLGFALHEFGEDNIRQAGEWFLKEKTPKAF